MESYKGFEFCDTEIIVADRYIRGSRIFLIYDVYDDKVRFKFMDGEHCDKFLSGEVDLVIAMLHESPNTPNLSLIHI